MQKEEIANEGKSQGEHEQIKYSNPQSQEAYHIKEGKEHLKEHLAYKNPNNKTPNEPFTKEMVGKNMKRF